MRKSRRRKSGIDTFSIVVIIVGLAVAALLSFSNYDPVSDFLGLNKRTSNQHAAVGMVQVHFIDVGQGDAALIVTENAAVLIDGGDSSSGKDVAVYLRKVGITRLDLIIASHPHADHIGGLPDVIASLEGVERLWLPRLPDELVPTTRAFMNLLESAEEHSVMVEYAETARSVTLGGGAFLEILSPDTGREFSGVNDYSLVARLVHGQNAFLFTGDMESAAEAALLESRLFVRSNVLAVAHHGSGTSSTYEFLEAVGGGYAVISVGSPNSYGHPRNDVLERLAQLGYVVLRTDVHGSIIFESNAEGELTFHTQN